MPLILGILVNYGIINEREDDNDESYYNHGIGEFLSKHNYTLMNIVEYQHRDDAMLLRSNNKQYSKKITKDLQNHRIVMMVFYIAFFQFPASIVILFPL